MQVIVIFVFFLIRIVGVMFLTYLYITSVVINGGGSDWAVMFGGFNG